jgi:adenylyltransferase/sulfurtransferase
MKPASPTSKLALDPSELARYGRHLVLPEVGLEGQLRLRAASVLLVGAGGLGSPLALYLAAAGVGRIGLIDFDRVDLSNLQRQILYGTSDVGRAKVAAATDRLRDVNPHVQLVPYEARLSAENAEDLFAEYAVIVDGTDNFPTRYLVNDACVLSGKPNVHGSVFRFEGQVTVFSAGGPCYRCLFPDPPDAGAVPNCAEGGVLGVLPGIIGTLQAAETIKWILGRGDSLSGRLLLLDALEMRFRELRLRRDPACPVCGDNPTIRELVESTPNCAGLPPQRATGGSEEIDAAGLHDRLQRGERPLLLDVRTQQEWSICHLAQAKLIPLPELESRFDEIDRAREIVVYCHVGMRGAAAAELLRSRGYTRVRNLLGGIEAWAATVDPGMARY